VLLGNQKKRGFASGTLCCFQQRGVAAQEGTSAHGHKRKRRNLGNQALKSYPVDYVLRIERLPWVFSKFPSEFLLNFFSH
jgi:hypothetical protein